MTEKLEYFRVNAADAYGKFGFLGTGGGAIRLDKSSREPNVEPEPMDPPVHPRRAGRLVEKTRQPDPEPRPVQKAKASLDDIDLEELRAWLGGDPEPELEPEPEPEPQAIVELDRPSNFHDLLLTQHGGQVVRRAEPSNSFVTFLRNSLTEKRQGILALIGE